MRESTLLEELNRAEDRQHLALMKLDAACHVCMYYNAMPKKAKDLAWIEKYKKLIEDASAALEALTASTDEMSELLGQMALE